MRKLQKQGHFHVIGTPKFLLDFYPKNAGES